MQTKEKSHIYILQQRHKFAALHTIRVISDPSRTSESIFRHLHSLSEPADAWPDLPGIGMQHSPPAFVHSLVTWLVETVRSGQWASNDDDNDATTNNERRMTIT